MNLKWYYWYFKSAIPEKICDDIVRYGKKQDKEIATTGNSSKKELTEGIKTALTKCRTAIKKAQS